MSMNDLTRTGYEGHEPSFGTFIKMYEDAKRIAAQGGGDRGTQTIGFGPKKTGYGYGAAVLDNQTNQGTGVIPLTPSGMPKFSDVPSIVNPVQQEVGTGTVLMQNQVSPQYVPDMFTLTPEERYNINTAAWNKYEQANPFNTGTTSQKVVTDSSTGNQVTAGGGVVVNPYQAPAGWDTAKTRAFQEDMGIKVDGVFGPNTRSQYEQWNRANANDAAFMQAQNTGQIDPNFNMGAINAGGPPQGTSWMDSLNNMFGLEGTDRMSAGDLAGGIGSGITAGLGAYGMFENLNAQQERIDQGWANYDLNKRQVDEHLREKAAIKEASKGW